MTREQWRCAARSKWRLAYRIPRAEGHAKTARVSRAEHRYPGDQDLAIQTWHRCPTQGGWSAPAARRQARSTGRGRPTAHRRDGGWDTYAQPYSGVVTEGFPVNFGPSSNSNKLATRALENETDPLLLPCQLRSSIAVHQYTSIGMK
jgi:hypothetical protein